MEIGTDASPWGIGGWLIADGKLTRFFTCPVSNDDRKMFDNPAGTSEGQQLWECLAVLVAVDAWSAMWNQRRVLLKDAWRQRVGFEYAHQNATDKPQASDSSEGACVAPC